jgi:hypothetical protein
MTYLTTMWAAIRQIALDPTSNLTAAVLIVAIVVLLALIVVITLLLWVTAGSRGSSRRARAADRDADEYEYPELSAELAPVLPGEKVRVVRDEPQSVAVRPPGPVTRWLAGPGGTLLVWGLIVAGLLGTFAGTSRDEFCADLCHGDGAAKSRATEAHKKVACVQCHEESGPAAALAVAIQRTTHLASNLLPVGSYRGAVPASRCLSCHAAVLKGTVTVKDLGVRISHQRPLESGMSCDDCHTNAGHGGSVAVRGMATCVPCHDGKRASSTCSVCHLGDTSEAVRTAGATGSGRIFGRVQLGPPQDCGGCHSQTACDACHGLRMPHSGTFKKWSHARAAAFSSKRTCYRCHTVEFCTKCHMPFTAHGADWAVAHRTAAPMGDLCSCHWPKVPVDARGPKGFCGLCH